METESKHDVMVNQVLIVFLSLAW